MEGGENIPPVNPAQAHLVMFKVPGAGILASRELNTILVIQGTSNWGRCGDGVAPSY